MSDAQPTDDQYVVEYERDVGQSTVSYRIEGPDHDHVRSLFQTVVSVDE